MTKLTKEIIQELREKYEEYAKQSGSCLETNAFLYWLEEHQEQEQEDDLSKYIGATDACKGVKPPTQEPIEEIHIHQSFDHFDHERLLDKLIDITAKLNEVIRKVNQ